MLISGVLQPKNEKEFLYGGYEQVILISDTFVLMKRNCALSIALIFNIIGIQLLNSQQIYQSQDYGTAGTQYLYSRHLVGFTDNEILLSGADVEWNISALEANVLNLSEIVPRDVAIDLFTFTTLCSLGGINPLVCLNIFQSTQQAWLQTDTQTLIQFDITDLQRFQRKNAQYLFETFFGFTVDIGNPLSAVVVYQSPDTVLHFPMEYEDAHTSRITWMIDLAATGQDIQYVSHQSRSSVVDGWGTLITPYDTLYDVLRVRAEIARNDTLTTDTLNIPVNVTQVEYTWYDTSYGLPVMIANGILLDTVENINSVSYIVNSECAAPTWTVNIDPTVYYLDSTGAVSVDFQLDMPNADTYAWDFDDGTMATTDSAVSHLFMSAGTYEIIVTGCMTNCLPLNSCTSQTVTIEVVDTTSAVHFIDPALAGIHIYPNPAGSYLHIDVPDLHEEVAYQLLDELGRHVAMGSLSASMHRIELNTTPGLYVLQLQDKVSGRRYAAVRVLVTR